MNNPYFNLIRAVWQNGKAWRRTIIGYYCAFIIGQAALSLNPYALGKTIDLLQNFTPDKLDDVIYWLIISVAVLLVFWLFHGPARIVERRVALNIQQTFRVRLYGELTELPLKWHQEHHSGNTISRINRASLALFRFAGDQYLYVETIIQLLTSLAFLLWISLPVGLLSLAACIITLVTVLLFDRKLIPLYDAENNIDNKVGAVLFDYISNMTTILTLRLGNLTKTNLFNRIMKVWPIYRKETVWNEVKWFSTGMLLAVLQAGILIGYIVYNLRADGAILIGTVVMIFRYQASLTEVFYTFSFSYSDLVHMDTDMQGLKPIADDIKKYAHKPEGASVARKWHELKIHNLVYRHSSGGKRGNILNGISLNVKRGEKIALIGTSGGGKSTLLNVLRGLYVADEVTLTIDDKTFHSLEPLQAITTLIPQDPEIFENTIAFNITLDVLADREEIDHAVKLAGFTKVLATLPQGLETDIREKGLNLSVGQKQRLALARGLFAARMSSLILMDEPTSSVDLPTEKEILSNVIEAFPDATVMVSLHRLHLLPKFDRIIMLSHGEIIANGKTEELLTQPGPVKDVWLKYHK